MARATKTGAFGVMVAMALAVPGIASAAPRDAAKPEPHAAPELEIVASSPVPASIRLAGHFGMRTGRTGARQFHAGVDFAAVAGTPVFAVTRGIVTHIASERDRHTRFGGYGNAVVVYHPDQDVWTMYAHLSEVRVVEGQSVSAGMPLGLTGATNNGRFPGMGAHLHFEVRQRSRDGREPFPGAYGAWNLDPHDWLASIGVPYGRDGFLHEDGSIDEGEPEGSEHCAHDEPEPEASALVASADDAAPKAMPFVRTRMHDEPAVLEITRRLRERLADAEAEVDAITSAG